MNTDTKIKPAIPSKPTSLTSSPVTKATTAPLGPVVTKTDTVETFVAAPPLTRFTTADFVVPAAPQSVQTAEPKTEKTSKYQTLKSLIGTKRNAAKDAISKGVAGIKASIVTGLQNAKAGLSKLFASAKQTASKVTVPSLPKPSLPKVNLPKVSLPTVSLPSFAGIKAALFGSKTAGNGSVVDVLDTDLKVASDTASTIGTKVSVEEVADEASK